MEILVEGEYFKAYVLAPRSRIIFIAFKEDELTLAAVTDKRFSQAKLIDNEGEFLKKLDAFNPKMIAEYQNTVEFCVSCLNDWRNVNE